MLGFATAALVHAGSVVGQHCQGYRLPSTHTLTPPLQGISNILWGWGQLRRRHGELFPLRTDVLSALAVMVGRMAPSFAVQVPRGNGAGLMPAQHCGSPAQLQSMHAAPPPARPRACPVPLWAVPT